MLNEQSLVMASYCSSSLRRNSVLEELRVEDVNVKNQITNMDDVCKFFDFVVFMCFLHFYVLFVLCVCVFLLCCFSFLNEFLLLPCANKYMMMMIEHIIAESVVCQVH